MHPGSPAAATIARPFLKWAGGKTQLLGQMRAFYPRGLDDGSITRYVEPFLGGGAVFLDVMQRSPHLEAHLYDINPELVVAYTAVQRDPQGLIELLSEYRRQHSQLDEPGRREFFYARRRRYNEQKATIDFHAYSQAWVERTADLIFLNKTCYNGLYRVNAAGRFNVPFGRYLKVEIFDPDNIRAVSAIMQRAEICWGSFEQCRSVVDSKTFVYFDPPYRPLSQTSNFTSYAADRFNDDDQRRLASLFTYLHATTGARLMLSNSDPKNYGATDTFFDDLYAGFNINRVAASRMINSKTAKRGKITEVLVTNYLYVEDQ
jgi:DNA adenine methylase